MGRNSIGNQRNRAFARFIRSTVASLAIGAMSMALSPAAVAQTEGVTGKAVKARGTTAAGATVKVTAAVDGSSTAGDACVSITGLINGKQKLEGGCGSLTVAIDELLSSGRVRGSLTTQYYDYGDHGWTYRGSHQITVDTTVSGTGLPRPGDDANNDVASVHWRDDPWTCGYTWPYNYLCYLHVEFQVDPPNTVLARDGSATGDVAGSAFGTRSFSGAGTLYLQRAAEQ